MRRELARGDATQCGFPCLLVAFRPFLLALLINFREITYAGSHYGYNGESEEDIPVRERTCLLFARAWDSGTFPIVAVSNAEAIVKGVERTTIRVSWLICAVGVTSDTRLAPTADRRSGPTSFRNDFLELA